MAEIMPEGYGPPTPVPIFQWEAEFSKLLEIYKEQKPKRVLEVGTYHGGTLYHWLKNAQPGSLVVSVDAYCSGIDNRHLYQSWCPPGVEVFSIQGNSMEQVTVDAAAYFAPYDWVWIDAGHEYHEVKSDWEKYGALCKPGGIVCFHDILPPSATWPKIEVSFLWKELKQKYWTKELIHDPKAAWGGIGVVNV